MQVKRKEAIVIFRTTKDRKAKAQAIAKREKVYVGELYEEALDAQYKEMKATQGDQ